MFELASRLVGVYKVNHMVSSNSFFYDRAVINVSLQTKSVTVENKDYITAR
jgi:hypothetical protein